MLYEIAFMGSLKTAFPRRPEFGKERFPKVRHLVLPLEFSRRCTEKNTMKITDALLAEHGVIYELLDQVEKLLSSPGCLAELQRVAELLGAVLISHARIEDELLFRNLEPHLGPDGPLGRMRHEHMEIEGALEEVAKALRQETALNRLRYVLVVTRKHFAMEDQLFFGLAQHALGDEELTRLGDLWAETRRITVR